MSAPPEQPTSSLASLTSNSANTQYFPARVLYPRAVHFSYKSKQDGKTIEKQ